MPDGASNDGADAASAEPAEPTDGAEIMSPADSLKFVGTIGVYILFFFAAAALLQPLVGGNS